MATLIIKRSGKFPVELRMGNGGRKSITPTMVDFDNQEAWHQKGQASENGEWIEFDDIEFEDVKEVNRQQTPIEIIIDGLFMQSFGVKFKDFDLDKTPLLPKN